MQTLRELADTSVPSAKIYGKVDASVSALDLSPCPPVGYVWPNLRDWQPGQGARVLLVEAAGAVGKSAAALALASHLSWPLVNSARAQVGSYSLSGLIYDALGLESTFLQDLIAGRTGIVIDALDEAHLKAGTTNFEAFVENIQKMSPGGDRDRPNIILFSRPDTADLVKLIFEEGGQPLSLCGIDFLSYAQASPFVRAHMERQASALPNRKEYKVALAFAEASEKLLRLRMHEVANALLNDSNVDVEKNWPQIRSFLGYAPVLTVLAEYIAVPNPHADHERVELAGVGHSREILLEIVDRILKREQGKFRDQVVAKLIAHVPAEEDWRLRELAYSPTEQAIRLISKHLDVDISVHPPASLPNAIRSEYERHASQFMADHPFLAGTNAVNGVFADFVRAKAAVDQDCRVSFESDPSKKVSAPGSFFYQFVHEFARHDDSRRPQVQEYLVPMLLASHSQSVMGTGDCNFTYGQSGEDAFLSLVDGISSVVSQSSVTFEIVELSGLLPIHDTLSRGIVYTDSGIHIKGKDKFLLGPCVTMYCHELVVDVEGISVDGSTRPQGDNLIFADEIVVTNNVTIDARKPQALRIFGDHNWPTLLAYVEKMPSVKDVIGYPNYMDLRAILKYFRQGVGDWPSVFNEKLDQQVIKSNARRIKYRSKLLGMGVLLTENHHYYLRTDRLAEHGLSLAKVLDGQIEGPVRRFLSLLEQENSS
ncbi:hypothetical protein [Actinokineospora sp. NBRC 105648]|uniref:hypothetical protein n=1 Tax=Actinokineospora sp. NBRC 105648 TaxID=3032206 RepID=UPI0024A4B1EB|nr:hypothetical protein [Actinokineospora sp. NBRC 105648]GLZ38997.1 hypothetical protein Acsp05_26210 [Actinokineospora sp. NBRC 105648]